MFFLQIVAMEALVRYSYNSRIKDITDLNVEVDIPDSNLTHTFHITGENIATLQRIPIPNVWGHINIVATGAGQAIAQLVRFLIIDVSRNFYYLLFFRTNKTWEGEAKPNLFND